jgi:GTP cyclohydrolase I
MAHDAPEDAVRALIAYLGENAHRPGLAETPARVIKAWRAMTSGYHAEVTEFMKTFEDGAENCDGMVFQGSIPVWSTCEHHMLPFFGVAHIGYLPQGRILGLSKFARVVDVFARRLSVQERITNQVADALAEHLKPLGVGVVLQCRHTCMEARGVKTAGSITTTQALRGDIKDHTGARDEFLSLVRTASERHW